VGEAAARSSWPLQGTDMEAVVEVRQIAEFGTSCRPRTPEQQRTGRSACASNGRKARDSGD
jgi:hypothetical protein